MPLSDIQSDDDSETMVSVCTYKCAEHLCNHPDWVAPEEEEEESTEGNFSLVIGSVFLMLTTLWL